MSNTTPAPAAVEFAADLSPVMVALEAAYRMIQKRFADAPDVTIVIKRDSRAWGHTTVAQVWADKAAEAGHLYEVMISGENLRRGAEAVAATLIHEAAHARNLNRGLRDCDVNGRHNLKFKAAAEEMGLKVENAGWHGHALTSLDEAGLKLWKALVARIQKGLDRAVVAAELPTAPAAPGVTITGLPGVGVAIAPPKRGGRRTLIKAECECGASIRVSQKVLDACVPTCQTCESPFTER